MQVFNNWLSSRWMHAWIYLDNWIILMCNAASFLMPWHILSLAFPTFLPALHLVRILRRVGLIPLLPTGDARQEASQHKLSLSLTLWPLHPAKLHGHGKTMVHPGGGTLLSSKNKWVLNLEENYLWWWQRCLLPWGRSQSEKIPTAWLPAYGIEEQVRDIASRRN